MCNWNWIIERPSGLILISKIWSWFSCNAQFLKVELVISTHFKIMTGCQVCKQYSNLRKGTLYHSPYWFNHWWNKQTADDENWTDVVFHDFKDYIPTNRPKLNKPHSFKVNLIIVQRDKLKTPRHSVKIVQGKHCHNLILLVRLVTKLL